DSPAGAGDRPVLQAPRRGDRRGADTRGVRLRQPADGGRRRPAADAGAPAHRRGHGHGHVLLVHRLRHDHRGRRRHPAGGHHPTRMALGRDRARQARADALVHSPDARPDPGTGAGGPCRHAGAGGSLQDNRRDVRAGTELSLAHTLPPGVRFIERDWLSANHILLVDPDATTMVDTGFVKHAPTTLALVDAALAHERPPARRIARIINTHLHSDHCGGNAAVRERHGSRITVPAASFEAARDWNVDALTYHETGQPCPHFPVDDALAPGEEFEAGGLRWVAHAAPGHDPDSLVLFAPDEGLLISADALW